MRRLFSLLALVALLVPATGADAQSKAREIGSSEVRAIIPAEPWPGDMGYPEELAVNGHTLYVSTPATYGTAGAAPAKVYGYDMRTGELESTFVMNQWTDYEHGLSGLAFDANDDLYVIDTQRGIIRLTLDGQTQEPYSAPFPNLPANNHGDQWPLPNGLAFDDAGYAYAPDSMQGVIWRVAPGGGVPQIWFQDPRLDTPFGPNGAKIDPTGNWLYFTLTLDDMGIGYVYRLPLVDAPTAADLEIVHVFPYQGPDGLVFGASGRLYVALALANHIAVLDTNGQEIGRYFGPALTADGAVAWDAPAGLAFDNMTGTLLVANHAANTGILENMVIFDVYVADRGLELVRPLLP